MFKCKTHDNKWSFCEFIKSKYSSWLYSIALIHLHHWCSNNNLPLVWILHHVHGGTSLSGYSACVNSISAGYRVCYYGWYQCDANEVTGYWDGNTYLCSDTQLCKIKLIVTYFHFIKQQFINCCCNSFEDINFCFIFLSITAIILKARFNLKVILVKISNTLYFYYIKL